MVAAEVLAGLQHQAKKCIVAPAWTLPTQDIIAEMRHILTNAHAPWSNFKIEPTARYLGFFVGPGATLEDQWRGPSVKWWDR
eukprot:3684608-Pyramimonas_sp.AAC.1